MDFGVVIVGPLLSAQSRWRHTIMKLIMTAISLIQARGAEAYNTMSREEHQTHTSGRGMVSVQTTSSCPWV
jgi:hypothetical protein